MLNHLICMYICMYMKIFVPKTRNPDTAKEYSSRTEEWNLASKNVPS